MYASLNIDGFTQLSIDETMTIDGGGPVMLFFGCIGLAVTPVVTCLNPPAGIALGVYSLGLFISNI